MASSSALITGFFDVLPESVLEMVACKLALDAAKSGRALAAGRAVVAMFEVCSTWGRVSHSELLWKDLVRHVWDMPQEAQRRSQTWRNEYIRRQLTASNFINNRAEHSLIRQRHASACLSLSLSPEYLAAGFSDGAVRIYSLTNKQCLDVLRPPMGEDPIIVDDRIRGIVIDGDKVVFASQGGHVFVGGVLQGLVRHIHRANEDCNLIDFIGSNKFWVGLYNLRHSCNIWDAVTEQLLINVTDISNPERMRGWHLLTQQERHIQHVQVNRNGILAVFRQGYYGVWFRQEKRLEASSNDGFLTASEDGSTIIRDVTDVEDGDSWPISFATVPDDDGGLLPGALNTRQAFLCIDRGVQVWNARSGNNIEPLYRLNEPMGVSPDILVADDEHVAGFADDETWIHLWSFRPSPEQVERSFNRRNIPEAAI